MTPGLAEMFKAIYLQKQEDFHKIFVLGCLTSLQSILDDESDRGLRRIKDNLTFVEGEGVGEENFLPPSPMLQKWCTCA